jgi:predicted nuclease with TOPRIM domain
VLKFINLKIAESRVLTAESFRKMNYKIDMYKEALENAANAYDEAMTKYHHLLQENIKMQESLKDFEKETTRLNKKLVFLQKQVDDLEHEVQLKAEFNEIDELSTVKLERIKKFVMTAHPAKYDVNDITRHVVEIIDGE